MGSSRRALVGGLSVLLPAAGIAYLGAVSYQEDRGIVAARVDEQFRAAERVATSVEARLEAALDREAAMFVATGGHPAPADLDALATEEPLAARPFLVSRAGRPVFPAARPLRAAGPAPASDRLLTRQSPPCPERGLLSCVRALRDERRRNEQLARARRAELDACDGSECRSDRLLADARRRYAALARHDDTAPDALLGLARLAVAAGDPDRAVARYRELGERFRDRLDDDSVPYGLMADLGAAEARGRPEALLGIYSDLIERNYRAPDEVLEVAADRVRSRLGQLTLDAAQQRQLAGLDLRLAAARHQARFAADLAGELDEIARVAVMQTRGQPMRGSRETIVYRREADGDVIGAVIDNAALGRVAAEADVDLAQVAKGAQARIVAAADTRADAGRMRTLASAGFGQILPHLSLEVVNDRSRPDPLDEIVRSRGRQHLVMTGALVVILVLGLVATIRGAARERELAQLKSDFVLTVSHELKTPLTSIRMFAEMLQQDVAGSDRNRERRYHDVIVKESERLGLLIANLLDYSQIEKGTRRYDQQRERAGEVLEDAVETFSRLREGEQPRVVVRGPAEAAGAEIAVDRDVVVQALLNLLANAAKYGGAGGDIEALVALRGEDRVALTVRDRGPGIPKPEQARIFKEFYRTPEAYRSGVEGTGLGLALVKRHVEAQGGEVDLDSAPDKGAAFSLVFPRIG